MKRFFVFLVFVYLDTVLASEHLLHNVIDEVQSGSYKYYSLTYDGLIKIRLTTQLGDADIYVSQTTTKPTYEPDNYCLQSTTCGEDVVYIPHSFVRPVSIGVYGHPSYDTSRYTLLVYQVTNPSGIYLEYQNFPDDNLPTPKNQKREKSSFVLSLLWSMIDILFHILF
ncbi:hypothetical protein TKK_0007641 [Trichogramma kaykai]